MDLSEVFINRHIQNFNFSLVNEFKQTKYFNYDVSEEDLLEKLESSKMRGVDYISVNIPVLIVSKRVTSHVLNEDELSEVKKQFEKFSVFNLIDGDTIENNKNEKNSEKPNIQIPSFIDKVDVIRKDLDIAIPMNQLLFLDIKTNIEQYDLTRFLNINDILGL